MPPSPTGKSRPVFFASSKLDDALTTYLRVRTECGHGLGYSSSFRGLDPDSRLFLSATGEASRSRPMESRGDTGFCAGPSWRPIASWSAMPTWRERRPCRAAELKDIDASLEFRVGCGAQRRQGEPESNSPT